MTHTELQRLSDMQLLSPDEEFAEVRLSFVVRLHGEQAGLARLATALGRAVLDPGRAFGDIEYFAHRLRGASAIFEFPALRDAAKALEVAASGAIREHAPNSEPSVHLAMRSLDARLEFLNLGTSSTEAAVAPVPSN